MADEEGRRSLFDLDGDRFVPTKWGRGPWDPRHLHGGTVAALLARATGRHRTVEPAVSARLTLELLRPVTTDPIEVSTELVRPGRSVQIVEAVAVQGGRPVAALRELRIRHKDQVLAPGPRPVLAFPGPGASIKMQPRRGEAGLHAGGMELRYAEGAFESPGPAIVWFRLAGSVVGDEEPTPLERVAAAADFGNGVSSPLSWSEWTFVNPDLTVYLHRPPVGEWVALAATTTGGGNGVALATSELFDEHGPIGRGAQSLLIDRRQDAGG